MSAEIKVLPTRAAEIHENVVSTLKEMLEAAEKGEIVAVAIAAVLSDKVTTSTSFSGSQCGPALLGSIHLLAHRLVEARSIEP